MGLHSSMACIIVIYSRYKYVSVSCNKVNNRKLETFKTFAFFSICGQL